LFTIAHAHLKSWQGQQNCHRLDVPKACDTVWRMGLHRQVLERLDGKLWRVLRDHNY
jgi:hypothetical protein